MSSGLVDQLAAAERQGAHVRGCRRWCGAGEERKKGGGEGRAKGGIVKEGGSHLAYLFDERRLFPRDRPVDWRHCDAVRAGRIVFPVLRGGVDLLERLPPLAPVRRLPRMVVHQVLRG